jgi:leader peptidase (prepilin peptidase)/N-methyltransferase
MSAVDAMRAAATNPNTTRRVRDAWSGVSGTARRAAVAAAATSVAVGTAAPSSGLVRPSTVVVGVVLALAALVDLREHRLPNRLLSGAMTAAMTGVVCTLDAGHIVRAGLGGLLAGGLLLVVHLSRGVGMGDVKMAAVVGVSTGAVTLTAAPLAVAVAALAAAAYGVWSRRQRMALGPALWFGWAIAIAMTTAGWCR